MKSLLVLTPWKTPPAVWMPIVSHAGSIRMPRWTTSTHGQFNDASQCIMVYSVSIVEILNWHTYFYFSSSHFASVFTVCCRARTWSQKLPWQLFNWLHNNLLTNIIIMLCLLTGNQVGNKIVNRTSFVTTMYQVVNSYLNSIIGSPIAVALAAIIHA